MSGKQPPGVRILVCFFLLLAITGCGGGGGGIAPTMTLSLSVNTPSEVSLSWSSHPGVVTGYDIVRDGDAAFPYHVAGTGYTDRNLEPLTRYCYIVYSIAWPVGIVGQSNQVCLTTPGTAGWNVDVIGLGDSPALALDPGNHPHVSYRSNGGVMLAYRSAAGWSQSLVDGTAGAAGDTDVQLDLFSADHLAYSDLVTGRLLHASNAAGVWNSEVADTAAGLVNALDVDGNGYAHIVYNSDDLNTAVVRYATNASGSWQAARLAGFSSASIRDIDTLVDAAGVVHIAFIASDIECYVYYMNNQGGVWQSHVVANGCNHGASMGIDSSGNVHIAYSEKFSLVHTHNTGGSWQTERIDSFSWIGGERVGLAIDNADRLHIAYQDQNADLKYATDASGVWEVFFLDSAGDVGDCPSIAVAPAGQVSIVYTDRTNGTVKLVTSP